MLKGIPGAAGWLTLIGGGELTFGETAAADAAWLARTPPGKIGFLPTASGSTDYGGHFAEYMSERFGREVEVVPIYRGRDARRGKNLERIAGCAGIYLGGGVTDTLLDTLLDSPAAEALLGRLRDGGSVAAITAAAQCLGLTARGLLQRGFTPGLSWLPGVIEPNFDPGHDRRLRQLLAASGARWGLGLAAGAAALFGPEGAVEIVGEVHRLDDPDGEPEPLPATLDPGPEDAANDP